MVNIEVYVPLIVISNFLLGESLSVCKRIRYPSVWSLMSVSLLGSGLVPECALNVCLSSLTVHLSFGFACQGRLSRCNLKCGFEVATQCSGDIR